MKKVLIIIGKLKIGGAERIGRDIGYYADKTKYEIHYLVYGKDKEFYEKELIKCGCFIHHVEPPSTNYIKYYLNLNVLIKKYKFDIIHSHTMFSSGWAVTAGAMHKVPIRIVHSHTIKGPEKRNLLKKSYENCMKVLIRRFATDFVACGDSAGEWCFGRDFYYRHGNRIYNGISLREYYFNECARKKIRQQYGVSESTLIIGHVGHLAPVKNQELLLRIMPEIHKRRPDSKLFLLGDGEDKEKLNNLIESLGIRDLVVMTGNVSNVGEYMSAMDIFAFPSLYEGMPLSLVEAQTNGLPCCISDHIPNDIRLTDLIHVIPIEDADNTWIDVICNLKRSNAQSYGEKMFRLGFDTSAMLNRVYSLYEKN